MPASLSNFRWAAEMGANIHASCVALAAAGAPFGAPDDAAILLIGPSGSGKSDLALRLIAAGAVLVADDRTDLTFENGQLIAAVPARLAGLIEVRGAGLVALPHRARSRVVLAVRLAPGETLARLPRPEYWTPPQGLEAARIPLLGVDPFEASAPAKVAAAAAAFVHNRFREALAPN